MRSPTRNIYVNQYGVAQGRASMKDDEQFRIARQLEEELQVLQNILAVGVDEHV